eukprot:GHVT01049105.1.p1 GENE.GHVT01049105.1~~GHVT01049105.1.p1  ORF type:complete len:367 (+),score=-7.26 GHVT01049105.1:38-1138(+)
MAYSQEAAMWYGIHAQEAEAPSRHDTYKKKPGVLVGSRCGIAQIILGVIMLATNIAGICIRSGRTYVGHGIWTGILLIIAGSFTIAAAKRKKNYHIITSLVMSILSALSCAVAIGLSGDGLSFNIKYTYYYYNYGSKIAVEVIILASALAAGIISIIVSTFICKSYSNTSSPQPTPLQASKTLDDYPQCSSLTIGMLQIVSGVGSIVLGLVAVCHWQVYRNTLAGYIAVGIWCGAAFFTHGVLACASAGQKTFCKTRAQTAFAYVAGVFALVQLGFASSGIYKDVYYLYRYVYHNRGSYDRIPVQSEVDESNARLVVTGMLLMFAIISGFCSFWGTIFGCRGLCKCCATPSWEKQIHFPAFTSKFF